jgi:hypothetical protein
MVGRENRVGRLNVWFDGLVLLFGDGARPSGAARTMVEGFSEARPVLQVGGSAAAGAGVRRLALNVTSDGFEAELRDALERAGVKRPILWAEDESAAAFLAGSDHFKVWRRPQEGMVSRVLSAIGKAAPVAQAATTCDVRLDDSNLDISFEALEATIAAKTNRLLEAAKTLNVLVLYDEVYTHIKAVQEHLQAFRQHSRHHFFFLPASAAPGFWKEVGDSWPDVWAFERFDVVVWHYGLRAALPGHIAPPVAERLARYDGLKVMFAQDEYENTFTVSGWIRRAGVDLMMTCVPPEGLDYVYPRDRHPGVEFLQTLTGYVPEDEVSDHFATPMAQRKLRLAYRGRILNYRYGDLGREKLLIGVRMKQFAKERGVAADIEVDEDSRIYGVDWYRFLGGARATLVSESGANVFDFDGSLKATEDAAQAASVSYEAFHAEHLVGRDGCVRMNQVSPKVFEAIRLRTALVCFEGEYSGVIRAGDHYIPLAKDFSNVDEVFAKLEDTAALEAMTQRAYADVIESGRYSYAAFAADFDRILETRVLRPARYEIISAPVFTRRRGADGFEMANKRTRFEYALNDGVLRGPFDRRWVGGVADASPPMRTDPGSPPAHAAIQRRAGAEDLRCYEYWSNAGASLEPAEGGVLLSTPPSVGHYAACFHLDWTGVVFDHQHCWIRVRLLQVAGDLSVSVFNSTENVVQLEQILRDGGEQTLLFRLDTPLGDMMMFRTGPSGRPASAIIHSMELLTALAYHPDVERIVDDMIQASA